jgi:hypothetical protein
MMLVHSACLSSSLPSADVHRLVEAVSFRGGALARSARHRRETLNQPLKQLRTILFMHLRLLDERISLIAHGFRGGCLAENK